MLVYKDSSGTRKTPADFGAIWLSDERVAELGLTPVSSDYQTPTIGASKAEKLVELDMIYQPQFTNLAQSLGVATLDGNQTAIAGIKEDYAALKAEYTSKMEALV